MEQQEKQAENKLFKLLKRMGLYATQEVKQRSQTSPKKTK